MSIDSVREGALSLSESERAELAAELLASLDSEPAENEDEVRRGWAAELERRALRLDSGEDHGIALDDALERVRTNLTE